MRPVLTYRIGSSYFFGNCEGYKEKDRDELCIMDTFRIERTNVLNLKRGKGDVFFYRDMDKEGFISDALESGVPMRAGKFLVREFAEHLGMDMGDLRKLDRLFNSMDDKHTYEKIIYEAYLANDGFYLTEDQLAEAYGEYRKKRPDIYGQ